MVAADAASVNAANARANFFIRWGSLLVRRLYTAGRASSGIRCCLRPSLPSSSRPRSRRMTVAAVRRFDRPSERPVIIEARALVNDDPCRERLVDLVISVKGGGKGWEQRKP